MISYNKEYINTCKKSRIKIQILISLNTCSFSLQLIVIINFIKNKNIHKMNNEIYWID